MKTTSLLICVCSFLSACTWLDRALASGSLAACPDLVDTYLIRPDDSAVQAFDALELSEQFQVYICAMQYAHPPVTEWVPTFAQGGDGVAGVLVAELARGVDDVTFHDIVLVFNEMHAQGTYDVASENLFLQWLDTRAEVISSAERRGLVVELIRELRTPARDGS